MTSGRPVDGKPEEEKKAIVVVSIGERHQALYAKTHGFMAHYAKRIGAALLHTNDIASIPSDLALAVRARSAGSSREPLPYVAKCYAIYEALGTCDRVALLDSTCIVRGSCPDLFSVVPQAAVGGYDESENRDFASWQIDGRLAQEKRGIALAQYFNTGMLVVSKRHRALFSPEAIAGDVDLFCGPYADQLFINVQLSLHAVPVFKLGREWNYVPIFNYRDRSQRQIEALSVEHLRLVQEQAHIVHVTGYYENRELILAQVAATLAGS